MWIQHLTDSVVFIGQSRIVWRNVWLLACLEGVKGAENGAEKVARGGIARCRLSDWGLTFFW